MKDRKIENIEKVKTHFKELLKDSEYTSQIEALITLLNGHNCFLSGGPGAGKSFIIKRFSELAKALNKKRVMLLSTTGISAVGIGGRTIHSALRTLATNPYDIDEQLYKSNDKDIVKSWDSAENNLKRTDIIIIDEISMASARLFDYLVKTLERIGRLDKVQVVVLGDFSQLAPVGKKSDDTGRFCYNTDSWNKLNFTTLYLDKSYRAEDEELKVLLNAINDGDEDLALNKVQKIKTSTQDSIPGTVYLTSTNKDADSTNVNQQAKNPNKMYVFKTLYGFEGVDYSKASEKDIEYAENAKIPSSVDLKPGDTVMVTQNNPDTDKGSAEELKNGTIGTFVVDENGTPGIEIPETGNTYYMPNLHTEVIKEQNLIEKKDKDGNIKYEREIITVSQVKYLPLKLSYAISIHKSQGQTFSNIYINLLNTWMTNLGYVALSRATSLDGITLKVNFDGKKVSSKALSISPESKNIKKEVLEKAKAYRKENLKKIAQDYLDYVEKLGDETLLLPQRDVVKTSEITEASSSDIEKIEIRVAELEEELVNIKNLLLKLKGGA